MIFIIVLCVLLITLVWSTIITLKWIELGKVILSIEDNLENAISTLNAHEKRIQSILEIPLASDDHFVKKVIANIRGARQAIEKIASILTNDFYENHIEDVVEDNVD